MINIKTAEVEILELIKKLKKLHSKVNVARWLDSDTVEVAKAYHKQKLEEKCEWKYDEDYEYYNTSCGVEYALTDGTLEDNEHYHCPFCGKKISLLTQEEE